MFKDNALFGASSRATFAPDDDVRVSFSHRADNDGCLVDTFDLVAGGVNYTTNLILPYSAPADGRWLIGSINNGFRGRNVWVYKDDMRVRAGFKGIAFPYAFKNMTYVLYVAATFQLVHVIPLVHLIQWPEPTLSPVESARLKLGISSLLGFTPIFTDEETDAMYHRTLIDCQGNRRLIKVVAYPGSAWVIRYEISTKADDGFESIEKLSTTILSIARKHFGHVPVPLAVKSGKTNFPGQGPAKGHSGGGTKSVDKKKKKK